MEQTVENGLEVDGSSDGAIRREIRQLLELLPEDVVGELNAGLIDVHDPAFLAGLTDHIGRQALAHPKNGNHLIARLAKVKKMIRRTLRNTDEGVETSSTIRREARRVGRNDPCPCGSGRKFKECCLGK